MYDLKSTMTDFFSIDRLPVAGLALTLFAVGCGDQMSDDDDDGGPKTVDKEVDNQCLDGNYSEDLPDPSADISNEKDNYSSDDIESFAVDVLDKRYPTGKWIVENGLDEGDETDCVADFAKNTSTADGVLRDLSTIVHECGHMFDIGQLEGTSTMTDATYAFKPGLKMTCEDGPSEQLGGKTMARGRILNDEYVSKNPPCEGENTKECDLYAKTYLSADLDNDTFEPGDQGFDMLLEEVVQYTNSLYTMYAYRDALREREVRTDLDGLLTFLWYMERYLKLARTEHPDKYATIKESSCWRKAILTVWGRAWNILAVTGNMDELGMQEDKMFRLVRKQELLDEIDRIRTAHGCD